MHKRVFYCVSMFVLVALIFSLAPVGKVSADAATITGEITGIPRDFGGLRVFATPIGGGGQSCETKTNWDGDSYPFTINGCDDTRQYQVSADGSGLTFNVVNATAFYGGTATVTGLAPVTRQISGVVYKPNGDPWTGFNLKYRLNDDGGTDTTVSTDGSGVYTITVSDANTVQWFANDSGYDGYWFDPGDQRWNAPLGGDMTQNIHAGGNRHINGNLNGYGTVCRAGATITAQGVGLATRTTVTDVNGHYDLNNLDPSDHYMIIPTKTGCVYQPAFQTVDVYLGDGRQDFNFNVPILSICGRVKTTLTTGNNDPTLAYYLIATYAVTGGNTYTAAVNWTGGDYCINTIPPNNGGTLSISRVGGAAAFGYATTGTTLTIPAMTTSLERNFMLTPNRTISGTIAGQNGVPIIKDSTVDFGYGLMWKQTSNGTDANKFTITNAQPKLYYLEPREPGIVSANPLRFLANLTAAPSVANANFTLNLFTYGLWGCLRTTNGEKPIVPASSMRLHANPGAGTANYNAVFPVDQNHNCDYNSVLYDIEPVPYGVSGNLEVDNHLVRNSANVDPMTGWLGGWNFDLFGDRAITGKIYVGNPDIQHQNDDWHTLSLRDATTNDYIDPGVDYQWNSWEFTFANLERKAYTVTFNKDKIPQGFDVQPVPLSKIVTANLTTADVDIPAASGFILVHKPIDATKATGGGFFTPPSGVLTQDLTWAKPEENNNDRINGYDIQVLPVTTAFTATTPITQSVYDWNQGFDHENPAAHLTGVTPNTAYHYRIRAIYQRDTGPWMASAPVPLSPKSTDLLQGAAGNVTFTWSAPSGVPSGAKYVVQYSTAANFPTGAATITLPATTLLTTPTTTPPTIRTVYYWRVKAQNNATPAVDISDWSPTQIFYNRYSPLTGPVLITESPSSVRFYADDSNPTLPPDAYYVVEFNNGSMPTSESLDDGNSFFFTKPASWATDRRLIVDKLTNGTYFWRIRIVVGNYPGDYTPITDWTAAASNFSSPLP